MKTNNDVRLSDETIEKVLLLMIESMKKSHSDGTLRLFGR